MLTHARPKRITASIYNGKMILVIDGFSKEDPDLHSAGLAISQLDTRIAARETPYESQGESVVHAQYEIRLSNDGMIFRSISAEEERTRDEP